MAKSFRPLGLTTRNSQVLSFEVRGTAGPVMGTRGVEGQKPGKLSVKAVITPEFARLLRDSRGRYTSAQRAVNEVHAAMAFQTVMEAARNLEDKVKAQPRPTGPRPGREGMGLRETLRKKFDQLYTVNYANRANAGFDLDFGRLDRIGPFDEGGRPYWRYVEYGFGGGTVRALFSDREGKFRAPSSSRQFMDPRMPNLSEKGAVFSISGFGGYRFIDETLKKRQAEIRREAYDKYVWELGWPKEVTGAAVRF